MGVATLESYLRITFEGRTYRTLFGPVRSRRLGVSLGVDMIPFKTCSLDCVYCECGATDSLTKEKKAWVPAAEIIEELDSYLSRNPAIDVVTFAGSGEPTLNIDLGIVISHVKKHWAAYKTVLITNSTTLSDPTVRDAVRGVDFILPSLDAISEDVFSKINVPVAGLTSQSVVDGLVDFSRDFSGTMWLEIFVVEGVNDTPEELALFKDVLGKIRPDRVQLNSLDRPGTCDWVKPASRARLEEIAWFFEEAGMTVEIVARGSV